MLDFTNLQSVRQEAYQYIDKLFKRIRLKGGLIDETMYIKPDEAYGITFGINSPWISQYFGEKYVTIDQVMVKARAVAFDGDKVDVTDAMRGLANNLVRQRTPVRHVVRHSLSEDLSMVARLRKALELSLKCDVPVYNVETTDEITLAHYYSYLYKFSPLSQYNPDIWLYNAKAYGEQRPVTLTDDDIDILAESVIAIQRAFGLDKVAETLKPNSLEDTQIRALATNPTAAYSFPTMSNAKSKEQRKVQLKLAKEYQANPAKYGNAPFVGQRRIQQGGNVLDVYMEKLYPGVDLKLNMPTLEQFDACMEVIAIERPSITYYSKNKVVSDSLSKYQRFQTQLMREPH